MLQTSLALQIEAGVPPRLRGRQGCVWRHPDGSICGTSHVDGDEHWLTWEQTGVLTFRHDSDVVRLWPARGSTPDLVRERFNREVTAVVLQSRGGEAMHASAVRCEAGAILICGATGAGKSTLAYALRVAGCEHLADDHVVFEIADGRPWLRPLPFTASLRPLSRRHFGAHGTNPRQPPAAAVPIAGVVLLHQDATLVETCRHERVSSSDAFTALLPHAHCFDLNDPAAVGRFVSDYWTLLERVPVYAVTYRPDFSMLSAVVARTRALFDNSRVRSDAGAMPSDND